MESTFAAPPNQSDDKLHLLLAASGSVATIKIPNIISAFREYSNISIRLILSDSATNFLAGQSHEQPTLAEIFALPNVDGIYQDRDEWSKPWVRGDKILHIELRRWADLLVVAPLSANTLAKMAHGISDNLLLSTIRAWDTTGQIDRGRQLLRYEGDEDPAVIDDDVSSRMISKKVIVVAPAMNTAMWHHPLTSQHVRILEEDWGIERGGWVHVLRPIEKELACGDIGSGAMIEWATIVLVIKKRLGLIA